MVGPTMHACKALMYIYVFNWCQNLPCMHACMHRMLQCASMRNKRTICHAVCHVSVCMATKLPQHVFDVCCPILQALHPVPKWINRGPEDSDQPEMQNRCISWQAMQLWCADIQIWTTLSTAIFPSQGHTIQQIFSARPGNWAPNTAFWLQWYLWVSTIWYRTTW